MCSSDLAMNPATTQTISPRPAECVLTNTRLGAAKMDGPMTAPTRKATALSRLIVRTSDLVDVVLDLRKRSGCYGRWITRSLSSENRDMIFIPPGCAHGFLALTDDATMVYQTNTVHAPASDAGVRWNSFGFDWSVPAPRLSERDRALPSLAEFTSPF